MRWFKHMTASSDDEKLARLKDKFGLEGYGFWWSVVEMVAANVDENGQTSAEFSAKKWGNSLGISPKKFRIMAEFCANLGLFQIKFNADYINIDMPNILKFRDEYTDRKSKKSGQNRENIGTNSGPHARALTETETETEIEEEIKSIKASAEPETVSAQQQAPEENSQDISLSENQRQDDPCVIELPIHGDPKIKTHKVFASDVAQYRELYPAVDVEQELRNMLGWCQANPTRQKTKIGIKRFIATWLAKAQNQGGNNTRASPQVQPKTWQQIQEEEYQKVIEEARKRDEARDRGEAV